MAERAEKPKILFLTTPGEVTQVGRNSYDDPRNISPHLTEVADIDVFRLDDSKDKITELAGEVARLINPWLNSYDGFVVTGGKLNLQYLAPRLAFAFGPNLNRTIAVAGTNIPASFSHSSARENLIRATMAASKPFNEVVISFENLIVRGTSYQVKERGSSLVSYLPYRQFEQLGDFTPIGVVINHLRDSSKLGKIDFSPDVETKMGQFDIVPGTDPELVKPLAYTRAGVIFASETAHLPTRDPYGFLPLLSDLFWKRIPTLVIGREISESSELTPDQEVIELFKGTVLKRINPMVAFTKFSWVLHRVEEEILGGTIDEKNKIAKVKEWMKAPYVGEFGIFRPFNAIQS